VKDVVSGARCGVPKVTIAFTAPRAQFGHTNLELLLLLDIQVPNLNRFLLAAGLCMALIDGVGAAEGSLPSDEASAKGASQAVSLDAQRALVCQTVADWAAYQVTDLIRGDARQNQAVSPEGMQILRQIRLTEALASAAFDKLAPQADHDSMYRDAVKKMQAYLKEDQHGADANTRRMVPVCQRTYAQMAAAGELSEERVLEATQASQESVARLNEELQGPAAAH